MRAFEDLGFFARIVGSLSFGQHCLHDLGLGAGDRCLGTAALVSPARKEGRRDMRRQAKETLVSADEPGIKRFGP